MPNKIQITTNYKRAIDVSKTVIGMLEKRVWPFSDPDIFPDAKVPNGIEPGSFEHAHYFFGVIVLDIGRDSIDVYRKGRQMAQKLRFSELPNLSPDCIKQFIYENLAKPSEEKKRVYGDPEKSWINNSQKLKAEFENDPRTLKAETLEETTRNIQSFRGYGSQNTWLLIKNMVKAGIWEFPLTEFNIKIDRHVIRISYGTGVIEVKGTNEIRHDVLVPYLSEVYSRVIKKEGISPIDLNDAFWAIGKYKCGKKNALYCLGNCDLGCKTKVYTAKQFTTLLLKQDTRKNTNNLFS